MRGLLEIRSRSGRLLQPGSEKQVTPVRYAVLISFSRSG